MNKAKYFTLGILVAALVVLLYCPSTLELEHKEPERITHERILFNAGKVATLSSEKYERLYVLEEERRLLRVLEKDQAERIAAKYVPLPKNE